MSENSQEPDSLDHDVTQAHSLDAGSSRADSLDRGQTAGGGGSSSSDISQFDEGWEQAVETGGLETRYQIEQPIGRGGMGEVYRALDNRLKRPVAIKRLKGDLSQNRRAVERFSREAEAVARLNHFNIVQIHDVGRDEQGHYIVMELVEGESLADLLKSSAMDLGEAIDLTGQLCDALAYAHEQGIVHRDVKPANILLTASGIPKLTDFGLARLESHDHGQTRAGAVLGTLDFMPPEQHRDAHRANARSDQWSLAATFYQLVTGESPRVIRSERLPEAVRDVVLQALEEDPAKRFDDCHAFRDALLDAKSSEPVRQASSKPLKPGACPACETVNDLQSTFCAGCGQSLRQPCLKCDQPLGVWAAFCTSCGADQASELEQRRAELAHQQSDVDSLRRSYRHAEAIEQLEVMAALQHPAFADLNVWAQNLLAEYRTELRELEKQRDEILQAATKRMNDHDVEGALKLLERVPEPMSNPRTSALRTQAESRVEKIRGLGAQIRSDVASKQLDGLLAKVEQFLALRPHDEKALKLHRQLQKREQRRANAAQETSPTEPARPPSVAPQSDHPSDSFESLPSPIVPNQPTRSRKKGQGRGRVVVLALAATLVIAAVIGGAVGVGFNPLARKEESSSTTNHSPPSSDDNSSTPASSAAGTPTEVAADVNQTAVRVNASQSLEGEVTNTDVAVSPDEPSPTEHASLAAEESDENWRTLFDGRDLSDWSTMDDGPVAWKVRDGYMEVVEGTGSIKTKLEFGPDFLLQVDFWVPWLPNKHGQARGNSGIFLLGRHEIQILDSFSSGDPLPNSCGALYGVIAPDTNRSGPSQSWQTFDILYRSPRYRADGSWLEWGQLTVALNGHVVIDDREIQVAYTKGAPIETKAATGPIVLQNHGDAVRFRNIRIRELQPQAKLVQSSPANANPPADDAAFPPDAIEFQGSRYKFFTERVSWHEAKRRCEAMGGHLPIVLNRAQNMFLTALASRSFPNTTPNREWWGIWLGATDEEQEGTWVWVDGETMTFENWHGNQPNNKQNQEHYALLWLPHDNPNAEKGVWVDQPVYSTQHHACFVCQWDAE